MIQVQSKQQKQQPTTTTTTMANPFDDDAPTTSRSTNPFGDDDDTPSGVGISGGINQGGGRSSLRPGVANQLMMSSTGPKHSSKRLILDDPTDTDTSDLNNNESSWQDLGDLPYRRYVICIFGCMLFVHVLMIKNLHISPPLLLQNFYCNMYVRTIIVYVYIPMSIGVDGNQKQ